MGDSMIDLDVQENYYKCCECEYCSSIVLHTTPPYLCVGCAKAGKYLYDDDKCPLNLWNTED